MYRGCIEGLGPISFGGMFGCIGRSEATYQATRVDQSLRVA